MSRATVEAVRSAAALQALTLHQPWATAVAELGKDVENRGWAPPKSAVGKVLAVHAGLTYDLPGAQSIQRELGLHPPGRHSCVKGAVVAVARLARAEQASRSRWAIPGAWHWCLEDVVRLEKPVPCRGAQGLWQLPPAALAEVRGQVLERESMRAAMAGLSPTEEPPTGLQKALAEAVAATRPGQRAEPEEQSKVVKCLWCGAFWHGEPGEPHAPIVARHRGAGWPECGHGVWFREDCQGHPVPPSCCAAEWRAAGGPLLAQWIAAELEASHG